MDAIEIRHFHLFCGLGGGAKGFNAASPRVGSLRARFRCIGGIDVDAAAVRDFERLAGVRGSCIDLFDRDQYRAFHGNEPPAGWRESTVADMQRAAGNERPHIVFLSAPCKGFSGLLSENLSRSEKYQALNRLTLRGIWLMLEAWADDPPELVLFENVPRIAQRGRHLLDQISALLSRYGYVVAETTHDCGAIGGLAQSRKRFLLVARHQAKVPAFLFQPQTHALRAVGTVLGRMLMPSDSRAGPMHRLPALHWKTWVRLAFVEAGSDWRSLNKLAVDNGFLRDFAIEPCFGGAYGVQPWSEPAITVTSRGTPTCGAFSVADPRIDGHAKSVQHGVLGWDETAGVVTGKMFVGGGHHAVADPRIAGAPRYNNAFRVIRWSDASAAVAGPGGAGGGLAVSDPRVGYSANSHRNKLAVVDWDSRAGTITGSTQVQGGALSVADPRGYGENTHHHALKVTSWDEHGGTITASRSPGSGALCVADPRSASGFGGKGKYIITPFDGAANTVIGGSTTGNGAFAVADPRLGGKRADSLDYRTAAPYGVVPWDEPTGAIAANGKHDNGRWSIADPRLPEPNDRLACVIRALDGTWHRPFTTLELAALQSLVDPEEQLELDGLSDSAWRERIGNAVPPAAAQAIAEVMGTTLLLAWSGETFTLSSQPIWVRPIALALCAPGVDRA